MKKILEVLQYGDHDIRFNTDIDTKKDPDIIPDVIIRAAWAMVTTLWGGNEQSVLAMIRALAIADLGVSVNRKDMVRFLDNASCDLERSMDEAREMARRDGIQIQTFAPGISPNKTRS